MLYQRGIIVFEFHNSIVDNTVDYVVIFSQLQIWISLSSMLYCAYRTIVKWPKFLNNIVWSSSVKPLEPAVFQRALVQKVHTIRFNNAVKFPREKLCGKTCLLQLFAAFASLIAKVFFILAYISVP